MFINAPEAHSRSFVKAVTWRALGSIDTFVISAVVTHNFVAAGSIASVETVTKLLLYYCHERAWQAVGWGRKPVAAEIAPKEAPEPEERDPARVFS